MSAQEQNTHQEKNKEVNVKKSDQKVEENAVKMLAEEVEVKCGDKKGDKAGYNAETKAGDKAGDNDGDNAGAKAEANEASAKGKASGRAIVKSSGKPEIKFDERLKAIENLPDGVLEVAERLTSRMRALILDPNMSEVFSGIDNTALETGKPQVIRSSQPDLDYIVIPGTKRSN